MKEVNITNFEDRFKELDSILLTYKVELTKLNVDVGNLKSKYLNALLLNFHEPLARIDKSNEIAQKIVDLGTIVIEELRRGELNTPAQLELTSLNENLETNALSPEYVNKIISKHDESLNNFLNVSLIYDQLINAINNIKKIIFQNKLLKLITSAVILFLIYFVIEQLINYYLNSNSDIIISLLIAAFITFIIQKLITNFVFRPLCVRQIRQCLIAIDNSLIKIN